MTTQKNDDTKNMYETLCRRFSPKNIAAWGKPDLVLIDGGKPQLSAAIEALSYRNVTLPIIAIAKKNEEIVVSREGSAISADHIERFRLSAPDGVAVYDDGAYTMINLHVGQRNLGSHTKNLRGEHTPSPFADVTKLFQRIRDEAHRFAVGYHTSLARKSQTKSKLDEIPGIGAITRRKLLKSFGSVQGVSRATEAEVAVVVGPKLAQVIKQAL
jgi:excinuclease ABC subunit C